MNIVGWQARQRYCKLEAGREKSTKIMLIKFTKKNIHRLILFRVLFSLALLIATRCVFEGSKFELDITEGKLKNRSGSTFVATTSSRVGYFGVLAYPFVLFTINSTVAASNVNITSQD